MGSSFKDVGVLLSGLVCGAAFMTIALFVVGLFP